MGQEITNTKDVLKVIWKIFFFETRSHWMALASLELILQIGLAMSLHVLIKFKLLYIGEITPLRSHKLPNKKVSDNCVIPHSQAVSQRCP